MRKFLFAGCGSIGRRHIRNLKALLPCEVLAWRVRNESLGDFEKEQELRVFTDLDDALAQKPEAVFVTNPTSLHLPVALKAAEHGCHLFIEKPLSDSLKDVDKLISLCEKRKLVALLGYKMRFHPSIRAIKDLLTEGSLGKLLILRAQYGGYLPDWHPWEDYRRMYSSRRELGGGVVLDAAIHELDYVYWLAGDIASVRSLCGNVSDLEIDTEDTAEILLKFKAGGIGSVHANYVQRPEFRSCHAVMEKGSIYWDTHRHSVDVYDADKKEWRRYPEKQNWDPNEMFMDEMKHFLACLDGSEKPLHDLRDAKKVLEIALAARDAGKNN